jgi:hypothetical protein
MSGKTKILSATAVAAALLATVAVARTVQTHVAAANATHGQATSSETVGMAIHTAPFVRHHNFACALANEADCEKIEMLLPK